MENSPIKPDKESVEESQKPQNEGPEVKEKNEEPVVNAIDEQDDETPKFSRKHDFTHTHPTHAKHKNFGLDHEPGAF